METQMGKIKVIKTPEGEPPEHVREAWVGLTLPCHPYMGYPSDGTLEYGVLTKEKAPRNRYAVSVPQDQALDILEKINPEAAKWWRERHYPILGDNFSFAEDEVQIIEGVTRQTITECRDEMQGDPHR